MIAILMCGQSCRDRLEREMPIWCRNGFLEVEILDRKVVIAVFVRSPNGSIIGFAQRVGLVFFGEIPSTPSHRY